MSVTYCGGQTRLHSRHLSLHLYVLFVSPVRAVFSGRSGPSPPRRCGWWPWPSQLAPGHAPQAAARCVAASPSGLPAAPWCQISYERSETTSLSAEKNKEMFLLVWRRFYGQKYPRIQTKNDLGLVRKKLRHPSSSTRGRALTAFL